ncbi:hypothetical protein GMRT_11723 [Giardia muris]|uniref:Uncharacterized protein n=1 Tax=Giardia muris TaxID=5742 RepID=A0A4Z1SM32_GIAMU|nr:hypothetical protein GMRT_11723 [Giardia muris]|eukprot:TNJ26732.1 hypothetical protein GMRT_11723 [Giardia muris]
MFESRGVQLPPLLTIVEADTDEVRDKTKIYARPVPMYRVEQTLQQQGYQHKSDFCDQVLMRAAAYRAYFTEHTAALQEIERDLQGFRGLSSIDIAQILNLLVSRSELNDAQSITKKLYEYMPELEDLRLDDVSERRLEDILTRLQVEKAGQI